MKKHPKLRVYKKSAVVRTRRPLLLVIIWHNDRSLKLLLFRNKAEIYSSTYKSGATTENFLSSLDNFLKKHHQRREDIKEIYLQNFSTSFSQIRLANIVTSILTHYSGQSFKQIKNKPVNLDK